MDIIVTLIFVAILWPVWSWSRILFNGSTLKLGVVNLLVGSIVGYISSELVEDNSIGTFIALFAVFSAYKSKSLYPKTYLIISTSVFVLAFYSFYIV